MSIRSKYGQREHMTSTTTVNKVPNKPSIHRTILKRDKKKLYKQSKVKEVLNSNARMKRESRQPANQPFDTSDGAVRTASEQEERELEAEAIRMILGETQRAKERVHTMGAIGWSRSSIPRINKQFARQIVTSTLATNTYNIKANEKKEKDKKY